MSNTTINIKNIGHNVGTVGWLKKGLESSEITIKEGHTKTSHTHGLWLHCGYKQECLALHDPYDLKDSHPEYNRYDPMRIDSSLGDPGSIGRTFGYTDACLKVLHDIASQWCGIKNMERDNDEVMQVVVSIGAEND